MLVDDEVFTPFRDDVGLQGGTWGTVVVQSSYTYNRAGSEYSNLTRGYLEMIPIGFHYFNTLTSIAVAASLPQLSKISHGRTAVNLKGRSVEEPAIKESIQPRFVERVSCFVDLHVRTCSRAVAALDEGDRMIRGSDKLQTESNSHAVESQV